MPPLSPPRPPPPAPKASKTPLEPRHVAAYSAWDDAPPKGPLWRFLSRLAYGDGGAGEPSDPAGRRGPRLGPSLEQEFASLGRAGRDEVGRRRAAPGGGWRGPARIGLERGGAPGRRRAAVGLPGALAAGGAPSPPSLPLPAPTQPPFLAPIPPQPSLAH
jgi:hypothetical protein